VQYCSAVMGGAEPSQGPIGWENILQLPLDILVNHVIVPYCSRLDKQALRQTSRCDLVVVVVVVVVVGGGGFSTY
jgi:hypothetical protein